MAAAKIDDPNDFHRGLSTESADDYRGLKIKGIRLGYLSNMEFISDITFDFWLSTLDVPLL